MSAHRVAAEEALDDADASCACVDLLQVPATTPARVALGGISGTRDSAAGGAHAAWVLACQEAAALAGECEIEVDVEVRAAARLTGASVYRLPQRGRRELLLGAARAGIDLVQRSSEGTNVDQARRALLEYVAPSSAGAGENDVEAAAACPMGCQMPWLSRLQL